MTQKPETSVTILNNLCQTRQWRPSYTVSGTKEDHTTYDIWTFSLEIAGNTWIEEGCSSKLKAKENLKGLKEREQNAMKKDKNRKERKREERYQKRKSAGTVENNKGGIQNESGKGTTKIGDLLIINHDGVAAFRKSE